LYLARGGFAVGEAAAEGTGLIRWSVVPHAFRRLLPEAVKSRDSHDIVLLCRGCHAKVERPYAERRRALFREAGVVEDTARCEESPTLTRVRSAGRALQSRARKLPTWRREELVSLLRDHFKVSELTDELVQQAACTEAKRLKAHYRSPEELLMASLCNSDQVAAAFGDFTRSWRRLFVETLQPSHLPAGWSVDHRSDSAR